MSTSSTETKKKLLEELWLSTVKELQKRIKSGEASPSDIATAGRILKDNGITIDPSTGDPLDFGEAGIDMTDSEEDHPALPFQANQ